MMTAQTRWLTAIALVLGLMAIGCASSDGKIDLSKIPIIIGVPPAQTMPHEPAPEPPKPRATLAFHVVDDLSGQPIPVAIVTFEDGTQLQANDDGYIAIEKELNTYQVKISADDYGTVTRNVVLTGNRQFPVRLTSTKPAAAPPKPEPPTVESPKVDPPPVVTPPVVTPPPAVSPIEEAAGWSDEQWRAYLMPLLKRHGELVNDASMKAARPEVNARGADFQNGWRGDLRPRIFLPVAGCSSAIPQDAPPCAYTRTVDLGQYGQPWEWIKR